MQPQNQSPATLNPPSPLGLTPSFGFGDRLGFATPGHLAALNAAGGPIRGIFAQQSIREMTRTCRTPQQVMNDAQQAITVAGYSDSWGADADHLKTSADVRSTIDAGFVFFTIDPSEVVDQQADRDTNEMLLSKFNAIYNMIDWLEHYRGKSVKLSTGLEIEFSPESVLRAAVKYGLAINRTIELARTIESEARQRNQQWEIEISVDETDQPTSLAEHYIFADQLRRHQVQIVSLAPRFIGEFEKGIDFKGDLTTFTDSLRHHAAIAEELGPYKLSLHSGSDKLSIYQALAQATHGRFHVKTAGTSYLEALRVVAQTSPNEFRRIVAFSRSRYNTDRATYHVSATLEQVPDPEFIQDARRLEAVYLECWSDVPSGTGFTAPGRQILHCTFGSVLTHPEFGPLIKQFLKENEALYTELLTEHFTHHLRALQIADSARL
ncbi:tagaturonate epimerase family protein [Planctomicrobium sp. SH527]|uniref:tagaturonate epimerase family protein n=1 Tax=Planctomicrobium sp. SH527 TaxID=3448123 RepID=UPI003F5C254F